MTQVLAPKEVKKEIDVTWEDQHKINTFNRLNTLFHELEDEIAVKREEINKIVDASDEIYLSDDIKYLVGEVFIDVDQDGAEQRLEKQKKEISKEVKSLEKQLEDVQKKMKKLKGELYAKFGNQINLEEK